MSRDKEGVLRLASEGNVITKPEDIIKQPTVLEFLGMEEKAKYSETDLETALINKSSLKGAFFIAKNREYKNNRQKNY